MFCAISGEAPEEPVVSKSGNLFEKRLIEKYIADHGKDPVTGEELTVDDLVTIHAHPSIVKPRPPKMSSVPSILSALQNEWDSVMLESFTLKQQYQKVRQELSHALYQNDAASRVIARLKKERDSAREALANIQEHLGASAPSQVEPAPAAESMDVDKTSLPDDVAEKITQTAKTLFDGRKDKNKEAAKHVNSDTIQAFSEKNTVPSLHAARPAGITALDIDRTGNLVLTGGMDKHVQVYDVSQEKVVGEMKGHTKKITAVKFRGLEDTNDIVLSASADKHVRVWGSGYKLLHNIAAHSDEVTGIDVHPSKDYFASSGLDSKWSLFDFETKKAIVDAKDSKYTEGFTAIQFHPDGALLGVGTSNGIMSLWDVKSQTVVGEFNDHTQKIRSLAFSENGYTLAVASEDNIVKIWDIRKPHVPAKTITLEEGYEINSLSYDPSCQFLAVGGKDVRIYSGKSKDLLKGLPELASFNVEGTGKLTTGLAWSPKSASLISCGMDRTLRFYAA